MRERTARMLRDALECKPTFSRDTETGATYWADWDGTTYQVEMRGNE